MQYLWNIELFRCGFFLFCHSPVHSHLLKLLVHFVMIFSAQFKKKSFWEVTRYFGGYLPFTNAFAYAVCTIWCGIWCIVQFIAGLKHHCLKYNCIHQSLLSWSSSFYNKRNQKRNGASEIVWSISTSSLHLISLCIRFSSSCATYFHILRKFIRLKRNSIEKSTVKNVKSIQFSKVKTSI